MAQRESHLISDAMNAYYHRSADDLRRMVERLVRNTLRVKWLQRVDASTPDKDGYEWGVFRVKRDEFGKVVEAERCNENLLDVDEAMKP